MQFELSNMQCIRQHVYMQLHIKRTCRIMLAAFSAVDAFSTSIIERSISCPSVPAICQKQQLTDLSQSRIQQSFEHIPNTNTEQCKSVEKRLCLTYSLFEKSKNYISQTNL